MMADAVHIFALFIIFGFIWGLMKAKLAGSRMGAAMAFIH